MQKITKLLLVISTIPFLGACVTSEYVGNSCTSLKNMHDQLGSKTRSLMVNALKKRGSHSTAKIVAKSYTNWPVYFIVKGNADFNKKMKSYENDYKNIRYASLENQCTYFRDITVTSLYRNAKNN